MKPGPKPFGEQVVRLACRWPAGSLPASLEASRRPSAGAAKASISAVAATAMSAGRRCTWRTHRSQKPGLSAGVSCAALPSADRADPATGEAEQRGQQCQ